MGGLGKRHERAGISGKVEGTDDDRVKRETAVTCLILHINKYIHAYTYIQTDIYIYVHICTFIHTYIPTHLPV